MATMLELFNDQYRGLAALEVARLHRFSSGSLVRIGAELVADTTAITHEECMAEIAVGLVGPRQNKVHRL